MSEQVDKIRIDHIHMAREIPKKDWLKSDHKIATLLKRIAELEAQVANFESDAYVLSLLTKIDELEALGDKV